MKKEKEYLSSLGLLNGLMKQCQCNANVFDKLLFQQPTYW